MTDDVNIVRSLVMKCQLDPGIHFRFGQAVAVLRRVAFGWRSARVCVMVVSCLNV